MVRRQIPPASAFPLRIFNIGNNRPVELWISLPPWRPFGRKGANALLPMQRVTCPRPMPMWTTLMARSVSTGDIH